ncbi:GntR family transcriptional regulator [Bauldia litoralis]|uniref:GntR family transcriptional regulator n=1 Tax=Bauldia litoralis TaxID=665467 RepID=UPI0032643B6F
MSKRTVSLESLPARQLSRSNGPLYRQLGEILRAPIADGKFPVGASLPKEAEIAEWFGISLITVRQALRELAAEGLIRKRSAKPAVVAAQAPPMRHAWNLRSFGDIAAATENAELVIRSYRREKSPEAAEIFGLAASERCYCLRAVLIARGRADTQVTTYFPPEIGMRLTRGNFDDVLIFRSVQKHLGLRLAAAAITVKAEVADADLAADLDCSEGEAVLTVEMLYRSVDQQPIEFTIARHRADVYTLTYDAPNDIP